MAIALPFDEGAKSLEGGNAMELRRTETAGADLFGDARPTKQEPKPRGRRSTTRIRPEKAAAQASLQWVTARLPAALVREIDALAKRAGVTRSDSIRDCLGIGIETIRGRDGVPSGRVDELLEALQGIRAAVDLVGPPTYGMLRLLAHWATRDRALKVSEDELLAEVRTNGADEWEQAIAEAEEDLPAVPKDGSPASED
jgi:ribbon-helix-helix CopG family protein